MIFDFPGIVHLNCDRQAFPNMALGLAGLSENRLVDWLMLR